MTKDQKKVKRAWVRALRSSKYKQGRGQLKTDDGKYCCLGVLCELAVKAGVISAYDPEDAAPAPAVCNWVGLQDNLGQFVKPDGHSDSLADLNDKGGIHSRDKRSAGFKTIARVIESEPEGLFESAE